MEFSTHYFPFIILLLKIDLRNQRKSFTTVNVNPTIPKVTLKVINQDRMFFADFSVNCQPIFMKFRNNHISTES